MTSQIRDAQHYAALGKTRKTPRLRCPRCHARTVAFIIDSRKGEDAEVVRRRYECVTCNGRYTTVERYEGER